jgi:FlaA1/EpsC-like NDP-sugar epimerase
MGFRLLREGYFSDTGQAERSLRQVAVVGAGDVGASLVRDLLMRRGLGMRPVAIFDDDRLKWGTSIHGVSVRGAPEQIPAFSAEHKLDRVILAMPNASAKRVRELVSLLAQAGLSFEIVPSVEQLVTGKVRVSQIRPVEIEDLLGRDAINLESARISEIVRGRVVMVTGAGGSIGSELCRQIAGYGPSRLLLVERCEYLLFLIEQELRENGLGAEIVPLVADIMDRDRMAGVFARYRPQVVFHAAAHKHVPMMENQPAEALRNNPFGTRILAELAIAHEVERFVLISSDKAINPTNVMGATKRLAEICLQALQKRAGTTRFMAVRFGNVLGSSGSVIPTFKKQIAAGGPVTVTHPDVTRYFMTVHEAVGLVLQTATLGHGGEIFILDMGKPIKIADLARQLIELSGLKPDEDIEIRFVGLRPGEKLFEELRHFSEDLKPTTHSRVLRLAAEPPDWAAIEPLWRELERTALTTDPEQLKMAIKKIVPEYSPFLG